MSLEEFIEKNAKKNIAMERLGEVVTTRLAMTQIVDVIAAGGWPKVDRVDANAYRVENLGKESRLMQCEQALGYYAQTERWQFVPLFPDRDVEGTGTKTGSYAKMIEHDVAEISPDKWVAGAHARSYFEKFKGKELI